MYLSLYERENYYCYYKWIEWNFNKDKLNLLNVVLLF